MLFCFLSGMKQLFSRIFALLLEFANHGNCKLNLSKCQAFHVGSNNNCLAKPFIDKGLKWSTKKCLGVVDTSQEV